MKTDKTITPEENPCCADEHEHEHEHHEHEHHHEHGEHEHEHDEHDHHHEHEHENHHDHGHSHGCSCCGHDHGGEEEKKSPLPRLIVSGVMFAAVLLLHIFTDVHPAVPFVIAAAAYIIAGYDVVLTAVKNIIHGEVFDECFLMTVSSIGAFCIGEYSEGLAVMILYQLGEWLSDLAVDKSRDSISALSNIRPDKAHVIRDGVESTISPYDVEVGELIVIKAGERIPVDGVVESGAGTVDTSSLTGESVPVAVDVGETVLSGALNCDGVIYVRTTATCRESTAEKIMDLVENAAENKSKSESFITKFAKVYTPIVVAVAACVAIIPSIITGNVSEWVRRGLVTLVISCPCALVISVPLTFFGGLGRASKSGILIKGSNYLEALSLVDTVVFDKTGTLTKGKFKITKIQPENQNNADLLLEYAAAAESMSNHPVAQSVMTAYAESGGAIDKNEITSSSEKAGRGVRAEYKNHRILAGNRAFIKEETGFEPEEVPTTGTNLYVAVDGEYLGSLCAEDEVKPESAEGISKLRQRGVSRLFMLSGDRKAAAEKVSSSLGLTGFCAELLPDGKLTEFEKIKKESSGKTVFVGDGINDSPVLASADIGIAMGGVGSDAAIEASDIVLMNDEVSKLAEGIDIAKKTRHLVIENITFSLIVKTAFMVLGALGITGMWIAVVGDVGVMMLAVLNSLRIMK